MRASLLGYIAAAVFASLWLSSFERSDSVTQRVVDPYPEAECLALEGGPLRCTLDFALESQCHTDTECEARDPWLAAHGYYDGEVRL